MPLVQLRVARRLQSFVQFSIEDLVIGLSQRICHEVLTPVIGAVPHTLSAQIVSENCIINDANLASHCEKTILVTSTRYISQIELFARINVRSQNAMYTQLYSRCDRPTATTSQNGNNTAAPAPQPASCQNTQAGPRVMCLWCVRCTSQLVKVGGATT